MCINTTAFYSVMERDWRAMDIGIKLLVSLVSCATIII